MIKLNKSCLSDRSMKASVYKYRRSRAKKMLKELKDPSIIKFCGYMLEKGECWSFLYTFLLSIEKV